VDGQRKRLRERTGTAGGVSIPTAIKSAIFPFAQPKTEATLNAICFFSEKLASVPASDSPEDFLEENKEDLI
jgi:hypothetical protein